ncbi:hypothetical protein KKB17_05505 [bacterium]|nr:hypothetical protein [bacterium]MBU4562845.1 hypothetical protein [bacterium]
MERKERATFRKRTKIREIIGTPIFFDIPSVKTYNLHKPRIALVVAVG